MVGRPVKFLLLAAGLLGMSLLAAAPALAYTVGSGSFGSAPGSVAAGQPFTFTATFKQPNGAPFPAGVPVTFTQVSGPSGCVASFNPVNTLTDANGTASTTVVLPTGCPGAFVLAATAEGSGSVTVTVVETGGFPNTSGEPAARHSTPWWVIGGVAGGAAGLAALLALLLRAAGPSAMRRSA